jgi:dTDP-4-amino-4,6-dideoxygalactose transaminase
MIPFVDLQAQYRALKPEIDAAVLGAIEKAHFILGPPVAAFETEFARFCGTAEAVGVNSGTSALHLALLAAGVAPGDEVITVPYTFVATVAAIEYAGARPVFVDVEPGYWTMDPAQIERALTPRTRAIVPVHLYGQPADLDAILKIGESRDLPVIEDACQAHGARWRGKRVGGFGLAATWSFYPPKNLGAYGEAGALTTNDDRVADVVRSLRDHGQTRRYYHGRVGWNYRMDGFQGAVLRVKLRHLAEWSRRRLDIARIYREVLTGSLVGFPQDEPRGESVYHLFVAYVDERDRVRTRLEAQGVHTAIHYPVPIHLQEAFEWLGLRAGSLPHTEQACRRVLSMPLYPEMTLEQARYAASTLRAVAESVAR